MVQINWTRQSVNDLENVFRFISKDSEHYAKLYIDKIRNKVKIIKDLPEIGREVPEIRKFNIREIILDNYRIIYKIIDNSRIDILTVHHSAKEFNVK
jgi:addiction module RelE/StbE family toxin